MFDPTTEYYGGLALIAILAWMSWQSEKMITMIILLMLGGYFIYTHNTGNTITDFSNETVDKINKAL